MQRIERTIPYEYGKLFYTVAGKGNPVVLLHGFGEDASVWHNQVDHLSNHYKLIIPDLPGSGKSSVLEKKQAGMEDYPACIELILENERIDQCVMIGHSMGGYITLAFADKYPGRLSAFGLFHSSAFADDEEKKETRRKAIRFIEQNGSAAFLDTSIPGLFFDATLHKSDLEALLNKGSQFPPEALIQYYEAMIARPDRTEILQTTTLPVLMIMGRHDKAVPFNLSLQQASMPSVAYIHILKNSGHMGMLEEASKSNVFLADFLQMVDFK